MGVGSEDSSGVSLPRTQQHASTKARIVVATDDASRGELMSYQDLKDACGGPSLWNTKYLRSKPSKLPWAP